MENTHGLAEASNETPLVIAAGDGVDVTDRSILLLLTSNEIDELDVSSLSFTASSANLAKSNRFGSDVTRLRFRSDDASSSKGMASGYF